MYVCLFCIEPGSIYTTFRSDEVTFVKAKMAEHGWKLGICEKTDVDQKLELNLTHCFIYVT